ncbi:hypothetical protein, partial [Klebsiella pneumoniae]|uniref:hypothetical protein n=1 Tax=Klebsiella pneumoniae TaxID=573 RepID=UPI0019545846
RFPARSAPGRHWRQHADGIVSIAVLAENSRPRANGTYAGSRFPPGRPQVSIARRRSALSAP